MRSVMFSAPLRGVVALALSIAVVLLLVQPVPVRAQDNLQQPLPPIDVITSRLNVSGGITGASTTIVTSEEIERSPEFSLQDILSREAGIQTNSLYGGVNGTGTILDMRGFGVTAPSNVLVLVDGRRFNDNDIPGFDFSLIPRNSIERIEITRGNSGGVLYGDGVIGGVINIVTKNGVGAAPNARVEGGFGSLNTREAKVSVSGSYNGLSAAGFGNFFRTDGYRVNNNTRQDQGVVDLRYTTQEGTVFFNVAADDLRQRLPGPRNIVVVNPFGATFNEYVTDRRGTTTPLDYGNRQNVALRGGATRNLWPGVEATLDGSFRQKQTQFGGFNPITFAPLNAPLFYNETELTTMSVTPRVNVDQTLGAIRARIIGGIDVYKTSYQSDRAAFFGARPNHVYDIDQLTSAGYVQPTLTFWNNTDISAGGRVQKNSLHARDNFDATAPVNLLGVVPAGLPLDASETNHATHLGFEHRFNSVFAVFGRLAQNFRVPNVDERVGTVSVFNGIVNGVPTDFNLRTQRSHDTEGGFRIHAGPFDMQTSVYRTTLTDELHFSPITSANVNLDPTLRRGVENTVVWRVTDALRLKGSATYTRATFRQGPFTGNDVPEVARWSGAAAVSWDIYRRYLTFDGVVRSVGKRFMDGDEFNVGRMRVPSYNVVDIRLGGEVEQFYWSVSVQNLFNKLYFDYGLDTTGFGVEFFSVYPLPGRVFEFRVGMRFG